MSDEKVQQLSPAQRAKLRNIEASASIEGTPISDMAREKIMDVMLGNITIEDAVQDITNHYTSG